MIPLDAIKIFLPSRRIRRKNVAKNETKKKKEKLELYIPSKDNIDLPIPIGSFAVN